jgi:NAD(P)-dependent dehydrogenase (short-subunit alcohol dehydrogenase family)
MKLSNKIALVIGGAAGLGRASAEACAAEGASVMIADINDQAGADAVAAIRDAGGSASFIHTDGMDDAAVKAAVDATVAQFGGVDILVNSIGGTEGRTGDAGWHLSIDLFLKSSYVGLTRTLALAYAKQSIRVNVICPGYFKTEMTAMIHDRDDGGMSHINENLRVPMGRWGEPREIGTVAAFLASDDSSFITGQPIIVDGGFMAR